MVGNVKDYKDYHEQVPRLSQKKLAAINTDEIFQDTMEQLSLWPKALYKLLGKADTNTVRRYCAFVVSLYQGGYFRTNVHDTDYTDTTTIQQTRARAMLIDMVGRKRSLYLQYAGSYYWKHFKKESPRQ